jgi:hypothetical protein
MALLGPVSFHEGSGSAEAAFAAQTAASANEPGAMELSTSAKWNTGTSVPGRTAGG